MSDLGNKEIFAKNLAMYMTRYNKTRNDISKILNVPYTTVRDWLKARTYPRIDKIEMLSNYFDIQKSDLIEKWSNNKNKNKIPVLGKIPAGIPIEAIEDIIDYEEISEEMIKGGKEYFGLKIKGNSMNPKYCDDDTVLFLKCNDCESGEDCAIIINSKDAIFRRIIKQENGIILQALNPEYESNFYSCENIEKLPITIIGIAKEIRRQT